MRPVVTGGAGFVGSHVVEALLARGDEVTVLDNLSSGRRENVPDGATFAEGDIREPLDSVFDAALPEVVFSSTGGAIYGECEAPAPETAERNPLSPYGTSKLAAEEYLASYNRLYGSGHVALRYGNVYGPRQDPHGEAGVVAIFFNCFLAGTTPKIYGDGRQTRDYVYAGDVARATLAAGGRDGGVFNVGTGRETSVLELYDLCREVAGADVEAERAPERVGELGRSVLDVSLAARELGWRPERALDEGLAATWAWFSRLPA